MPHTNSTSAGPRQGRSSISNGSDENSIAESSFSHGVAGLKRKS